MQHVQKPMQVKSPDMFTHLRENSRSAYQTETTAVTAKANMQNPDLEDQPEFVDPSI